MALVEIRDVSKSFSREAQTVDVYNGLTIDFEEGSFQPTKEWAAWGEAERRR